MDLSSEVRVQRRRRMQRRDVYIHGDAFGKKSGKWDGEKKKKKKKWIVLMTPVNK